MPTWPTGLHSSSTRGVCGFLEGCNFSGFNITRFDLPRLRGAAAWLDELPALVASLEREWLIVVGRPFDDASEAFVAEPTLADGTPAALV